MLNVGTPIEQAIMDISENSTPYLRSHMDEMLYRMRNAEPYRYVVSTGLFPKDVYMLLQSFIRVKDFGDVIGFMGEEARTKGIEKIKIIMKIINALLMLIITAVTLWMGLAFFSMSLGGIGGLN